MSLRLRISSVATAALLVSVVDALADCGIKEFDWAEGNWQQVCNWPECCTCTTQAQWNEAKKNIDWVLFEDAGALQTFKGAYKEAKRCESSSLGGPNKSVTMLRAILLCSET
jgi:hypothetical protein